MKKIREVLRLRFDRGASVREISISCSMAISTVHEYLNRAGGCGVKWPLPEELTDAELEAALFPGRVKKGERPRPLPDFLEVRRELSRKGVTLLLLWREYKAENPRGYGYSRFAELYTNWEKTTDLRMLQRHKAGEKMFADWAGQTLDITNPETGEVWQAPLFVSCMGASQYTFGRIYDSQEQGNWLDAHVKAFEFYGALPEIVVPDNLKTGVLRPCRFEPSLNPSYADLAQFYEIAVLPARPYKPRDKAKVENAVQQGERWLLAPLRNRTFFSVEEANEALSAALDELNEKKMKGPGLSRKELFELEDKPAMRPLPASRYTYAAWKKAKLAPDYHVQIEGHFYSAPFCYAGKTLDVRLSQNTVEFFHKGQRIASHLRSFSRRGFTTLDEHMPEHHRKHAAWTSERVVRWAGTVGPNTAAFVDALLTGKLHPEHGFRMCMGVISLEKKFGRERLEAACAKALALGALSYQSVKSILTKNLEAVPSHQSLPGLPAHGNVRGGSYYAHGEVICANSL